LHARVIGDLRVVPAIVLLRLGAGAELGDVLRDHAEKALIVEEAFRDEPIEAIGAVRRPRLVDGDADVSLARGDRHVKESGAGPTTTGGAFSRPHAKVDESAATKVRRSGE
jgi:hypothetical protein